MKTVWESVPGKGDMVRLVSALLEDMLVIKQLSQQVSHMKRAVEKK